MASEQILDYGRSAKPVMGPLGAFCLVLLASVMLQAALLPCLCNASTVKMMFAAGLDIAFVVRYCIAMMWKQGNRGWLFWGIVVLSSGYWIEPVLFSPITRSLLQAAGIGPP